MDLITNLVTNWIDRYYKPDRLNALPGRRKRIIEDRIKDVRHYSYAVISKNDSVTGKQEMFSNSYPHYFSGR